MLSLNVDERVEIANLLTDAGYSVRNELAANFERFELRLTDDDWDVIFIDARESYESVSRVLDLVRRDGAGVPVFGLVDPPTGKPGRFDGTGSCRSFRS